MNTAGEQTDTQHNSGSSWREGERERESSNKSRAKNNCEQMNSRGQ